MANTFQTSNKPMIAVWAKYAEGQLKESALMTQCPQWEDWSEQLLPTMHFYMRPFSQAGYSDPLQSQIGMGFKFYDMPLPEISKTGSNTSSWSGYMAFAGYAPTPVDIENWLDKVCKLATDAMKQVMRIMQQRQRRGFNPWMGKQATAHQRRFGHGRQDLP